MNYLLYFLLVILFIPVGYLFNRKSFKKSLSDFIFVLILCIVMVIKILLNNPMQEKYLLLSSVGFDIGWLIKEKTIKNKTIKNKTKKIKTKIIK